MRENLRVEQSYLSAITDLSTGPRHGDPIAKQLAELVTRVAANAKELEIVTADKESKQGVSSNRCRSIREQQHERERH